VVDWVVSTGPGRKGARWRKAQALCMARGEAQGLPCWGCGRPIDYAFSRLYPQHRMAGTAHHIVGLEQGGHPYDQRNLAPCHRGCNTSISNQLRAKSRPALRTSRQW